MSVIKMYENGYAVDGEGRISDIDDKGNKK